MLTGMEPFEPYLARWGLQTDGMAFASLNARLLPVRRGTEPAMLKIATAAEEERGAATLAWWNGEGAARVLHRDGPALLMERAQSGRSLAPVARQGWDEEATRILCAVTARLHAPRLNALVDLVTLPELFRDLGPAAKMHVAQPCGGLLGRAHVTARTLLANPREPLVLHGDLHHGNVLDFGPGRGWLAIDPKGLWGEHGFDLAASSRTPTSTAPTPTRPWRPFLPSSSDAWR